MPSGSRSAYRNLMDPIYPNSFRIRSGCCLRLGYTNERKKPGPEARVESGIRSESAPTAVLPVPVASAAATTSAAAEGAELELPVPAAAAASLAAVTATAVAGLALVFDRADV